MKVLLFAAAVACVLVAGGLFLVQHSDPVAPVMPVASSAAVDEAPASGPEKIDERSPALPTKREDRSVARAAKSTAARELTAAELKALQVETPPGVLEGIVLRHAEPITTGGLVFLQVGDGFYMRLPEHPRAQAAVADIRSADIDAHGVFRFADLSANSYTLGLDLGHDLQNERRFNVTGRRSARIVIELGGASVHGHVHDENGGLLAGAKVTIGPGSGTPASRDFRTSRTTRVDGEYTITDLRAGDWWLGVDLHGNRAPSSFDEMVQITLASDEDRIVDFGSPEPQRTWTGTVRSTAGDHVHGSGRLYLTRRAGQVRSEKPFGKDGAIHVDLHPGEYAVQVSLDADYERRIDAPDLSIGSENVTRDITVPGARVSGVVIDEATGQPLRGAVGASIGLHARDSIVLRAYGDVDENGVFAIDAVQPGTWLASAHPLRLVEGDHEVTVRDGDVDIPLRLTVVTR